MKNKGIMQQIKEKEVNKADSAEVTIDDIMEWKKQLDDADTSKRQYTIMKYCPHKNDLVSINFPLQEGDCEICFQEIMDRFFNKDK